MVLTGKEFDTKSAKTVDNMAIIILNPSNSIGKVRIITPVEIASKRFLNLVSPLFIIPKILVSERKIVVTDQITSNQEIAIAIEKIAVASYRTRTPSGLPDTSDNSNRTGIP